MVSAVDDPRYAVYAANEQRVLRSGLLVLVLISTLMSMAIIVVNAKDYFALKNVCCVGNYGPCASFLIRSSFGVIFSSITLYVGSGQIFVDTDIFTLVTGLLCIVMSFFALRSFMERTLAMSVSRVFFFSLSATMKSGGSR